MEDHQMIMIIKDVFGESSDSDDNDHNIQQTQFDDSNGEGGQFQLIFGKIPTWEPVSEIKGLWLCRDFLSHEQQYSLASAIENEGWFTEVSHNQAMRFGHLPVWSSELGNLVRDVVHLSEHFSESVDIAACNDDKDAYLLPSNLLWREPFFDQLIVNVYQPGEGICAHVDLMRFEDGIAIVSLESCCVMHFTRVETEGDIIGEEKEMDPAAMPKIPVYLTPGSLVLMWGEARFHWKHEINRSPGFQKWEGEDIDQKRRTSITLRKLCPE